MRRTEKCKKRASPVLFRSKCRMEKIVDTRDSVIIIYSVKVKLLGCIYYELLRCRNVKNASNPLKDFPSDVNIMCPN